MGKIIKHGSSFIELKDSSDSLTAQPEMKITAIRTYGEFDEHSNIAKITFNIRNLDFWELMLDCTDICLIDFKECKLKDSLESIRNEIDKLIKTATKKKDKTKTDNN